MLEKNIHSKEIVLKELIVRKNNKMKKILHRIGDFPHVIILAKLEDFILSVMNNIN